jgi:hypothetical protein
MCKVGPAALWLASYPTQPNGLQVLRSCFEEQLYVTGDLVLFNCVENKHICDFCQQWETEAFRDPWFWATSEEEFDFWDLGCQPPKDRQDH